jgi:hypothetical protein
MYHVVLDTGANPVGKKLRDGKKVQVNYIVGAINLPKAKINSSHTLFN